MKHLIFMLCFFSVSTLASDTTTGKVTIVGGQHVTPASIYFGLENAPNNRPACSTHNNYFYVFDPKTEEGKALYSILLMAKTTGRTMTVKGSGNCVLNQPMESVVYWVLQD